jgi:hypothetical protein
MFKAIILALLMASTVQAQTVATLEAEIEAKRVAILALQNADHVAGSGRAVIVCTASVDTFTNAKTYGIKLLEDDRDSMYVRVDFPLSSKVGVEAYALSAFIASIDKGIKTDVTGQVKLRKDRVVGVYEAWSVIFGK